MRPRNVWVPAVGMLLALATGLAACGGGSAGTAAKSTEPSKPVSSVPTESQLKSALLTADELGAPWQAYTSSGGGAGSASGCEPLASELNSTSTNPGEVSVNAEFAAGSLAFVEQKLVAEPASTFDASLKKAKDAIGTCNTNLVLNADGMTLSFDVTPFNFAPGSTGARLDATYQGVQVNGYLSVARVSNRNIALSFLYLQIGSSSSQNADHIYRLADDKATRTFPPS